MQTRASAAIDEHDVMTAGVRDMVAEIARAAEVLAASLMSGGKILLCGNGGSAADAQHIAAEFLGRFLRERSPMPAIALHANTSAMTAIGNDYGFDDVFARQVRAFAGPDDVLIAISTSGQSANVLRAAQAAKDNGMSVIGMTSSSASPIEPLCDVCLAIPSPSTPRIQEGHILVGHMLCEIVEDALFPSKTPS